MRKPIWGLGIIVALWLSLHPAIAHAAASDTGFKLFNANCAACHLSGSNLVIASKTLKRNALERYGMYSVDAIKTQVTNGKNSMPSFKSRLTKTQIEEVSAFVFNRATTGW